MQKAVLGAAGVLLLAAAVRGDVESGPKAGEKVGELKVRAVAGPIENKDVDYAAERKDAPTVYLFVNAGKFDRPTFRFLKALDGKVGDAGETAAAVAVWVGGDAEKNKEYLPKLQTSGNFEKTALAAYTGDGPGPNGWGINADAHLTAVVVAGGKVVKSFAYTSVNENDAKPVLEELVKAAKK